LKAGNGFDILNTIGGKMGNFNIRASVSIALFFLVIILFITAVGIQILDAVIDPEIIISMYLVPEKQASSFLVELQHIITAIHVITGFLFCGLSIIHVLKNWKALKNHFRNN
jgi:cytochrome b561